MTMRLAWTLCVLALVLASTRAQQNNEPRNWTPDGEQWPSDHDGEQTPAPTLNETAAADVAVVDRTVGFPNDDDDGGGNDDDRDNDNDAVSQSQGQEHSVHDLGFAELTEIMNAAKRNARRRLSLVRQRRQAVHNNTDGDADQPNEQQSSGDQGDDDDQPPTEQDRADERQLLALLVSDQQQRHAEV